VLALARQCPPKSFEEIRSQLTRDGCVLFEGAQGVLLDERRGFHPHTTWSSINTVAVDGICSRFEIETPVEHYGVMRTYLTRHGAGPLPTHDKALDALLPEAHNRGDGWQKNFRRGHPDAVLLRYALEAAGQLSGLFISHLDIFQRGQSLKWCDSYSIEPAVAQWPRSIDRLPLSVSEDLDHQLSLTQLLQNACPNYNSQMICSESDFLRRVCGVTSLPIALCSHGPTCADVCEKRVCA
jgi:adenylosuccinate synthase